MKCQARCVYFLRGNPELAIKTKRVIRLKKKNIRKRVPSELEINFWALFIKILNATSEVDPPVCGSSSTLGSNLRFILTNAVRKKTKTPIGKILLYPPINSLKLDLVTLLSFLVEASLLLCFFIINSAITIRIALFF